MARFDVFANPDSGDRRHVPYFLDVQNDFLEEIDTRVVIPLWTPAAFRRSVRSLNPAVSVEGKQLVLDPAGIGAVPASELRRAVCNVADQQLAIQDALDTLFGSY